MPTSDSGESQRRAMPERSPAAESAPALPCPRCESANTKFCYYNNYNLSQPRHFCKACRRYWTHGGTLRDVPVGGGSRKNAKRTRVAVGVNGATSSASSSSDHPPLSKPDSESDPARTPDPNESSTYTSLLSSQAPGFLALSGYGYGLGLGQGLEEMGFGYGYGQVGGGDFGASGGSGAACNAWQMNSGSDGGLADSVDCFAWPDLSISMPGNGLK